MNEMFSTNYERSRPKLQSGPSLISIIECGLGFFIRFPFSSGLTRLEAGRPNVLDGNLPSPHSTQLLDDSISLIKHATQLFEECSTNQLFSCLTSHPPCSIKKKILSHLTSIFRPEHFSKYSLGCPPLLPQTQTILTIKSSHSNADHTLCVARLYEEPFQVFDAFVNKNRPISELVQI